MTSVKPFSPEEAIRLGARDIPTFGQIFFPKTFRQGSPLLHYNMSAELENPEHRLVALEIFRDGAKTTLARTYMAKRIAYCISRTLLIVNINATKAQHSLRWLKRQVEYNAPYRDTFRLKKSSKWTDEWAVLENSEGQTVNVVAMGITGGLRGLNIDDYRPDFIFCDDICDAENVATEDGRKKIEEAVFAQLVRSLAPVSESPLAQLAIAQTPINSFDILAKAKKDPTFKVFTHSCFDAAGESSWPERRSTNELLLEKEGYIRRNQLATWLAEMECTIVSSVSQAFRQEWLKRWQVFPGSGRFLIAIDPASSEEAKADLFAMALLLIHEGRFYLIEYHTERGMMPDAACSKIFEWVTRYGCRELVVETVAYQKILKWYIEKEMLARRIYIRVSEFRDRRSKDDRMVQAITQVAPFGNFLVPETCPEFEEVFTLYGPGYGGKVDLLDAVSIGISHALQLQIADTDDDALEGEYERLRQEDLGVSETVGFQGAP